MGNSNGNLINIGMPYIIIQDSGWFCLGLGRSGDFKKDGTNLTTCMGGDFGEEIHDGNFCINGLVSPDRTPRSSI